MPVQIPSRANPTTRSSVHQYGSLASNLPNQPHLLCFGEAFLRAGQDAPLDPAGVPAVIACAAARLGTPSGFAGRLADDRNGRRLGRLFQERQVATGAIQWDDSRPSRIVDEPVRRSAAPEFADEAVVPATLAEDVMPLLADARWLVVTTNPLSSLANSQALDLLLKRATARGVAIALAIDWRPTFWGMAAGASPPPEVRRRVRPLAETASLILASTDEACQFFETSDPERLHDSFAKRPGVLVTTPSGEVQWCLGGRCGIHQAAPEWSGGEMSDFRNVFHAALLDGLCRRPELLRVAVPAGESNQSPGPIEELLGFASAAAGLTTSRQASVEGQPSRAEVLDFLRRNPDLAAADPAGKAVGVAAVRGEGACRLPAAIASSI
jgi:fructokinase